MKYDFTYLSLGGGVQSGTIAEMIVEGEIEKPNAIYFSDTGDEPQSVYDHVEYLRERLESVGVEIKIVTAGDMVKDIMTEGRRFAAIPVYTKRINENGEINVGKMRRQCTREYKIEPIEKQLRRDLMALGLAKQTGAGIRVKKGLKVKCTLGISLDEFQRMKTNPKRWIDNRFPLIDRKMSRWDCAVWLTKKGLPIPEKSSCRICPFHNDAHFRTVKKDHPGDWDHVVKFDHFLRSGKSKLVASAKDELFLHRSCMPIDKVDFSNAEDHGQLSFDFCDEGYCFI